MTREYLLGLGGAMLLVASLPLQAATIYVTDPSDGKPGSLRLAVLEAEQSPGQDTIEFRFLHPTEENVTLHLTEGEIVIRSDLVILGWFPLDRLRISADSISRVLRVESGATVEIIGMTLADGRAPGGEENEGGAIYNAGSLTLTTCRVVDSSAFAGGGIFNDGGQVFMTDTTIARNRAFSGGGGGIATGRGKVVLLESAVHDNEAGPPTIFGVAGGGGILSTDKAAEVVLVNTTVTRNTASNGAGIDIQEGTAVLDSVTITDNSATSSLGIGGIRSAQIGSRAELRNSILAGNHPQLSPPGCTPTPPISLGYNLVDSPCNARLTDNDLELGAGPLEGLTISDVLITTAAPNGGPSLTHALVPGSPAIDAGSCEGISSDQRRVPRPFDVSEADNRVDGCDIGAFELSPDTCVSTGSSQIVTGEGTVLDWSDVFAWTCRRRPGAGDSVVIAPGHVVNVKADEEVETVHVAGGGGGSSLGGGRLGLPTYPEVLGIRGDLINGGVVSGAASFRGRKSQRIQTAGRTRFQTLIIENEAPDSSDVVQAKGALEVLDRTEIRRGQLDLQSAAKLHHVELLAEASLHAPPEQTMEVSGNMEKAPAGAFEARGGKVVLNGPQAQTVSGGYVFQNMEIDKTGDDQARSVETGPETRVQGQMEILRGLLRAGPGSKVHDVMIADQGVLQAPSQAAAPLEVSGNMEKAPAGTFEARGGKVVFNGPQAQTVSAGYVFQNMEVDKTGDDQARSLETGPETQVQGQMEILRGLLRVGPGSKLHDVMIANQGELQTPAQTATPMRISGDVQSSGKLTAQSAQIVFDGKDRQQQMTLARSTQLAVDLANPLGLWLAQLPGAGTERSDLRLCKSRVVIDLIKSGDVVEVACGSITMSVHVGPVEAFLGEEEQIQVTVPDSTSIRAETLDNGDIEIESLPGSTGTVTVLAGGKELELKPGKTVTVPAGEDRCPGFDACLLAGKFAVKGTMKDFGSPPRILDVQVMQLPTERAESDQAAFFESFTHGNFEVGVKMVNGCSFPEGNPLHHVWAFFGGLTNAETKVVVEDTMTGQKLIWQNPAGVFPHTLGNTSAFPCVDGVPVLTCQREVATACLLNRRFKVTGTMSDFHTPPRVFELKVMSFPRGRAESDQAVFFDSFNRGNFEVGVKMVDGCGLPEGNPLRFFWVFYGGLTNAETRIEVTQLATGLVDIWSNPAGVFPVSVGRTNAFPCE